MSARGMRPAERDGNAKAKPPHARAITWGELARILAALAVLLPAYFLALEGLLRLAGVGFDPGFLEEARGGSALQTNRDFGRRVFAETAKLYPDPAIVPLARTAGERRIAVVGGSAAQGDLDRGYGFGRFLETLLQVEFPERSMRVVPGTMPGVNSHLARLMVRDILRLRPDLLLLYLANNEVVGPFGPGAFSEEILPDDYAPGLLAIRSYLWLGSTRIGQLLESEARRATASQPSERPAPGEPASHLLRPGDAALAAAYRHYRANLDDILARCAEADVPVVLFSVPTNLRSSPPLWSVHADGLDQPGRAAFRRALQQGRRLQKAGRYAAALNAYRTATQLDGGFALLHFRIGSLHESMGNRAAALESFVRARELDAVRARADSQINEIIRRSAERFDGVRLIDLAAEWEGDSERPIPGDETFYDHAHLTLQGSYRIAARALREVRPILGLESRNAGSGEVPSFQVTAAALPVTAWDRHQLALGKLRRGIEPRPAAAESARIPPRRMLLAARRLYLEKLERFPEDLYILDQLAGLSLALGLDREALVVADRLLEQRDDVADWHQLRGRALALLNRGEEARAAVARARAIDPTLEESRADAAALQNAK